MRLICFAVFLGTYVVCGIGTPLSEQYVRSIRSRRVLPENEPHNIVKRSAFHFSHHADGTSKKRNGVEMAKNDRQPVFKNVEKKNNALESHDMLIQKKDLAVDKMEETPVDKKDYVKQKITFYKNVEINHNPLYGNATDSGDVSPLGFRRRYNGPIGMHPLATFMGGPYAGMYGPYAGMYGGYLGGMHAYPHSYMPWGYPHPSMYGSFFGSIHAYPYGFMPNAIAWDSVHLMGSPASMNSYGLGGAYFPPLYY